MGKRTYRRMLETMSLKRGAYFSDRRMVLHLWKEIQRMIYMCNWSATELIPNRRMRDLLG